MALVSIEVSDQFIRLTPRAPSWVVWALPTCTGQLGLLSGVAGDGLMCFMFAGIRCVRRTLKYLNVFEE